MNIEKYIDEYLRGYRNYKNYWNYEDGTVLLGAKQLYEATGDGKYFAFIENYLKNFITEDGTIEHYEMTQYNIDSINCGKILFFMFEKTGEEKYRKAIEIMMDQLRSQPRCVCGSFFHKGIYPNQIWLDGLYMALPFYMEYETKYEKKEKYNDIINQFSNAQKLLYNKERGLYYHAYDEMKEQFWADRKTGCSPNFWLRSMGWYLMAIVDTMDNMSFEIFEQYKKLEGIFKQALSGILKYQDEESKLFYQIVDRGDTVGNYLETSGSAMIAYSIMKACRMGILLKEKYVCRGIEILESLLNNKLTEADGEIHLTGICQMAGLGPETKPDRDGSVEYYLSEKVVNDDPKGVGPLMMAYGQYLQLKKEME